MAINRKDTWVAFALQALRCARIYDPRLWFSAYAFIESLGPHVQPADARWSGAVFQRAKREGLIRNVVMCGKPLVVSTPAGHRTPVWTFTDR